MIIPESNIKRPDNLLFEKVGSQFPAKYYSKKRNAWLREGQDFSTPSIYLIIDYLIVFFNGYRYITVLSPLSWI